MPVRYDSICSFIHKVLIKVPARQQQPVASGWFGETRRWQQRSHLGSGPLNGIATHSVMAHKVMFVVPRESGSVDVLVRVWFYVWLCARLLAYHVCPGFLCLCAHACTHLTNKEQTKCVRGVPGRLIPYVRCPPWVLQQQLSPRPTSHVSNMAVWLNKYSPASPWAPATGRR